MPNVRQDTLPLTRTQGNDADLGKPPTARAPAQASDTHVEVTIDNDIGEDSQSLHQSTTVPTTTKEAMDAALAVGTPTRETGKTSAKALPNKAVGFITSGPMNKGLVKGEAVTPGPPQNTHGYAHIKYPTIDKCTITATTIIAPQINWSDRLGCDSRPAPN